MVCPQYSDLREKFIPSKFFTHPNVRKFNMLMATNNVTTIRNMAMFLYHAMERRKIFLG